VRRTGEAWTDLMGRFAVTIQRVSIALILGLGLSAVAGADGRRGDSRAQPASVDPQAAAPAPGEEEHANGLKLDPEAQTRIGLVLGSARAITIQPEIRAMGVIEADPSRSFTVRAPIAGFLQSNSGDWPALGATLGDHAPVGAVQPRLTPLEQFTLASQLVEARSAVAEIEAEVAADQASYESKRTLNAEGKMVSDRQFEEAESKLRASQARLAGAQQKLALLEEQHGAAQNGLGPLPIRVESGGQVVEVLASPGEAVDSGQALLRIARYDRLIARVELPLGDLWDSPAAESRIAVIGEEDQVVRARTIGPSPRAGPRTRGQAWLLEMDNAGAGMVPGTPVLAFLPASGPPIQGVLVPSSAILRYGGLTWVYVRGAGEAFERRAVQLHSPTPDGWLVTGGLEAETTLVEHGGQVLLSEQLKAQIEAEEEAAE